MHLYEFGAGFINSGEWSFHQRRAVEVELKEHLGYKVRTGK